MSMETTIQEEQSQREWDRYAETHPDATQYHRWHWRTVVEQSFGHTTYYLSARQNNRIVGLLPLVVMKSRLFGKFMISMPFFNYGGLLSDTSDAADRLLQRAEEIGHREDIAFIELRHLRKQPSLPATKEHKVTMILELEKNEDRQWAAFGAKLRNQIRKAQKSGLSLSAGGSELLDEFYHVFSINMRDLGTPVYAKRFFQNILGQFPDASQLFIVRCQDRPVAAALAVWFRETLEIPWASSIHHYRALCPNNFLYWEAIRWAIHHGFRQFDFGRSTVGEGTYKFKEQWGAQPVPLYWQYRLRQGASLPDLSPKNPKYRLAVELWRRCPVSITRWIGPRIVKHIP